VFLAIGFVGLLRMWIRRDSHRPVLMTLALIGILLVSWPPADWLLSRPLEMPYGQLMPEDRKAQAIVVPGAHVEPPGDDYPLPLANTSAYARCRYAAWLYREWRQVPIIVSGGTRSATQPPVAAAMARLLEAEGVPDGAILQETNSINTWENARFTAELLRSRGIREIALVVEADQMLRADLCFRKQGLSVIPAPFRQRSVSLSLDDLLPSWSAIRRNEITLHEVLGLAWYKLRGRI
jgi:uncharacterized SAM-binding protein YcdF (DUF218 family)